MANSVEKTGKTVDAAVFSALEELGATIDEVIVEVLDEGEGGILGIGRKPARVLVTLDRLDETYARSDLPDEDDEKQYNYQDPSVNDADFKDPGMFSNEDVEDLQEAMEAQPQHDEYFGDDSDYLDESAEELMDQAKAYIRAVLEAMDINAQIQTSYHDGSVYVDVEGEDVGAVIGRRGETLNALQYLLTLSMNHESEQRNRVVLDVSGYRKRREKALQDLALRTASRVMKVGKEYVMEDMPASERRIIHATLQNHSGVRTISEGDEPHRYVVVVPLRKSQR